MALELALVEVNIMNKIKCPICNKHDIPDFLSQDVVCPCCGSDLSIYRLVDQIESIAKPESTIKPKSNKYTVYIFTFLTVILLLASCFMIAKISYCNARLHDYEAKYKALVSENDALKDSVSDSVVIVEHPKESPAFKYIVRKGDSFWVISRKLYGTGARYKEIAEANGLEVTSVLNIGDELIIK